MAARDRLKRRIEIANGTYVAPRAGSGARVDRDVHSINGQAINGQAISGQAINGQSAIAAAFPDAPPVSDGTVGADDGSEALLGYDDLSPALLGEMEASRWNVWMRGTFTHFDGDAFSGDTWHGIGGVDYRYTSNILIGALAGYEGGDFEFSSTNGAFDGTGFTTGAYVGVKLSETLVMDAFLTHTWLDYDNRAGTATGETDATRIMVSVNMSGRYGITDSLTLEPNIRLFYAHESQDAYTLSNGTAIAANGIDSGRLSLGPKLRYLLPDQSNGNWSVFVSAHGEYDFSSGVQTSTALPDFDDLVTARLGAGIDGTLLNGWMIQLAGDVGGLGSGSFVSYTGTGRVRIPLN
jgi:outer membrane autotransporter protein